jgi:conjugative transfer signal peptidase TraF
VTVGYLVSAILAAGALATSIIATPPVLLTWNTTASMPTGLYRIVRAGPSRGQVVLSRLPPSIETHAVALGILLPGAPVIKRIAAVAGDLVCRIGSMVAINGRPIAVARHLDPHLRTLPAWQGCRRLAFNQVLLLGSHADSFDGRYFGPSDARLCLGVARPILVWK